jgi:porin
MAPTISSQACQPLPTHGFAQGKVGRAVRSRRRRLAEGSARLVPCAARLVALLLCSSVAVVPASAQNAQPNEPTLSVSYVTDLLLNADGGNRRGLGWLGRADLVLEFPGEAIGIGAVAFFVDIMALHGNDFTGRFVQDGQVVSNIDAPSTVRPIEAWARMDLTSGNSFKLGLIDLNGDFDVQNVGGHFINSSHGIGPDFSQSGLNGPSIFPNTTLGAVLAHSGEGFAARVGVFDAMPGSLEHPGRPVLGLTMANGALLVGEIEARTAGTTTLRLGGWHYTKEFELIVPEIRTHGQSSGLYAMAEGSLAQAGGSSLDAWLRIGTARSAVNPISAYVGGGVTFGDDRSRVGAALSHARLGHPGQTGLQRDGIMPQAAETSVEVTYSTRIDDVLQLQPSVQYIVNPGWDRQRADAFVVGVRLSVEFGLN